MEIYLDIWRHDENILKTLIQRYLRGKRKTNDTIYDKNYANREKYNYVQDLIYITRRYGELQQIKVNK